MTDNTHKLDELLVRFRNGTINPDPKKWGIDEADLHYAKQAILQWVADEVEKSRPGFLPADGRDGDYLYSKVGIHNLAIQEYRERMLLGLKREGWVE